MDWMNAIGGLVSQQGGLGGALASILRSTDTPPFAQLAAQIFGNSNGSQKAAVLNELLSTLGPGLLDKYGLGSLVSGGSITPQDAEQVPDHVVQQAAESAEQADPSIVDRLGSLYSQHPEIVQALTGLLQR